MSTPSQGSTKMRYEADEKALQGMFKALFEKVLNQLLKKAQSVDAYQSVGKMPVAPMFAHLRDPRDPKSPPVKVPEVDFGDIKPYESSSELSLHQHCDESPAPLPAASLVPLTPMSAGPNIVLSTPDSAKSEHRYRDDYDEEDEFFGRSPMSAKLAEGQVVPRLSPLTKTSLRAAPSYGQIYRDYESTVKADPYGDKFLYVPGQMVDVKDSVGVWREAQVQAVRDKDGDGTHVKIKIHYVGWKREWNEWVRQLSDRVTLYRTHTVEGKSTAYSGHSASEMDQSGFDSLEYVSSTDEGESDDLFGVEDSSENDYDSSFASERKEEKMEIASDGEFYFSAGRRTPSLSRIHHRRRNKSKKAISVRKLLELDREERREAQGYFTMDILTNADQFCTLVGGLMLFFVMFLVFQITAMRQQQALLSRTNVEHSPNFGGGK